MGAINYFTSDYITIGVNCNNIESDDDYIFINDCYDQVKYLLEKERFNYFTVEIKPGYYEGFSIRIKFDLLYFYNGREKHDAQREITRLKVFLLKCVNDFNLCAVFPGWCTTYYNKKDTLQALNDAIKDMRDHVKITPTEKKFDFKKWYA